MMTQNFQVTRYDNFFKNQVFNCFDIFFDALIYAGILKFMNVTEHTPFCDRLSFFAFQKFKSFLTGTPRSQSLFTI